MAATLKLETTTPAVVRPEDILTPAEVAARLKVKPSWIFEQTRIRGKIRNKGKPPLPYHRVGKFLRFHWPEVSAWWLLQNKD
jgi:hypothetical protein